MHRPVDILAIAGSLRAGSYNRALLTAAAELAPAGMTLTPIEIGGLPFFDGDLEAAGAPEHVEKFRQAVARADGLLIATPEYNRGLPAVLKNALDWASRPAAGPPLNGKAVAIVGASTGMGGTRRAQEQLRQALVFPGARVLEEPRLLVPLAYERFDEDGRLIDPEARATLADLLEALHDAAVGSEALVAA